MESKFNLKDLNFTIYQESCPKCNQQMQSADIDIDKNINYQRIFSLKSIKVMLLKALPQFVANIVFKFLKDDIEISIKDKINLVVKTSVCPYCKHRDADIANFELGDYDII